VLFRSQSDDWLDDDKRIAALKTLRDYTLANFANIKVDNSLDADGKTFADYMKIYSDEFAAHVRKEAELEGKKLELEKTFALDDYTYQIAKDVSAQTNIFVSEEIPSCTCGMTVTKRIVCKTYADGTGSAVSAPVTAEKCDCKCVSCSPKTCVDKKEKPKYRQRLKRMPGNRSHYIR
jgi:hypothetical protein